MNKKLIMTITAVLLTMASATAEWYYDWNTGYGGNVLVMYAGSNKNGVSLETVRDNGLNNLRKNTILRVGNKIDKLTKEQSWLAWKAIEREYDYREGDIFYLTIATTSSCIAIFAEITASGKSFYWYAYPVFL